MCHCQLSFASLAEYIWSGSWKIPILSITRAEQAPSPGTVARVHYGHQDVKIAELIPEYGSDVSLYIWLRAGRSTFDAPNWPNLAILKGNFRQISRN